jgi:hypothetical protein
MYLDFNAFTRMFFYLFVCYHYAKYNYPKNTEQFLIFMGYNSIYLYSKLQIILNKKISEAHNFLIKYEEYRKVYSFFQKIKDIIYDSISCKESRSEITTTPNKITMDFISHNEINVSFEKDEFLNDYLSVFFPNENNEEVELDDDVNESIISLGKKALESLLLIDEIDDFENIDYKSNTKTEIDNKANDIIDYDFIIVTGEDSLKKIIKHDGLMKNDFVSENSSIFKLEPFLYKPLLCEFLNGDDKPIKIDFNSNNKFYDFLVVGNCFDKTVLTYFMKKYYDINVNDNYILKVLDNNVESLSFNSSDILKFDENSISKVTK